MNKKIRLREFENTFQWVSTNEQPFRRRKRWSCSFFLFFPYFFLSFFLSLMLMLLAANQVTKGTHLNWLSTYRAIC
jgi:hypothetical protein